MTSLDPTRRSAGRLGPILPFEDNAQRASLMSEEQLQNVILHAAEQYGWLAYHTFDSRRSAAGYPDLHLVHEGHGISLLRELKSQTGRLRTDQAKWLHALKAAGVDADVWRPIDWFDGTISARLLPDQPDQPSYLRRGGS